MSWLKIIKIAYDFGFKDFAFYGIPLFMGDDCYALALPLDIYAAFALRKQFCIDMEIDFKDLINARIELNSFCENNEVD
jgi:hypothetical protein